MLNSKYNAIHSLKPGGSVFLVHTNENDATNFKLRAHQIAESKNWTVSTNIRTEDEHGYTSIEFNFNPGNAKKGTRVWRTA